MTKRKASTLTVLYPEAPARSNGAPDTEAVADPDVAPFGDAPDELGCATEQALVQPEQPAPEPAPARAPQRERQRRITAEVSKAETKLIQLARCREESLRHHAASWDAKRAAYISALPFDVRAALVAMRVLEPGDAVED